ncbi:hypothetical protein [Teredinibacter purpureus]|uniref:hypothetical protein n=1 Tax=Teredinibacter purpureus TaxID=2731756 RepID=UPI0005F7F77D|nr:hypothetical protein [Teredinibacter purpureus]
MSNIHLLPTQKTFSAAKQIQATTGHTIRTTKNGLLTLEQPRSTSEEQPAPRNPITIKKIRGMCAHTFVFNQPEPTPPAAA